MVVRRVANSAPALLALVNKTKKRRSRNMPARRKTRRRSGGRRMNFRSRATTSPRRRMSRRRSNPFAISYTRGRRRRNYARSRRRANYGRRRRRNPTVSGGQIMEFAVSGLVLAMVQPLASNFLGGIAGNLLGNFTSPAITAATGWGLGFIADKMNFSRRFSQPLVILGLSTAVIQLVQPYFSNLLGGGASAPAPAQTMSGPWPHTYSGWTKWNPGLGRQRANRRLRGLGVVTAIPPMIMTPAGPVAATNGSTNGASNGQPPGAPAGMSGFTVRPGVWAQ